MKIADTEVFLYFSEALSVGAESILSYILSWMFYVKFPCHSMT